jgi:hypothetical protein
MKKLTYYSLFLICPFLHLSNVASSQITLILQPGAEDGKDALINTWDPDLNHGDYMDYIALDWTQGGTPWTARSLIEFDLSSVPMGSTIISAFLSLYNNPQSPNNFGEHSSLSGPNTCWLLRMTEEWDEHTVTWNNQPATTWLHQVTLHKEISPHHDYENIIVTQLVQDMVDDPENGHGFLFRLITEQYYRCMIFGSSDCADSTLHPKLVVTYFPASSICTLKNVNDDRSFNGQFGNSSSFISKMVMADPFSLENDLNSYCPYDNQEMILDAGNLALIPDLPDNQSIFIYPNPVRDRIYIKITGYQNESGHCQLFNANGQLFRKAELPVNNCISELDVTDLQRGIYFLSIISQGHSYTCRVMLH